MTKVCTYTVRTVTSIIYRKDKNVQTINPVQMLFLHFTVKSKHLKITFSEISELAIASYGHPLCWKTKGGGKFSLIPQ